MKKYLSKILRIASCMAIYAILGLISSFSDALTFLGVLILIEIIFETIERIIASKKAKV